MATRRYREAINIAVLSNDHYLTAGNMDIVIVKKTGTQLPQGYMKRDYPAPPTTAEVEITDKELWTVREAEQPAGLAALATAAQQQQQQQPPPVFKTILKPIPQRIAWLIAEDSSKSKETCAITTDEISPITAAVTTCFHVFEYESIQEWVNKNPARPTCPVCREVCAITKAFEG